MLGKKGEAFSWRPLRSRKEENIPSINLNDVVVIGNGSISTQALHLLMEKNIPVHYIDSGGRYKGSLTSGRGRGYMLRRFQYESALNQEQIVLLSKSFVTGKLLNQRQTLLRLLYRSHKGDGLFQNACAEIAILARKTAQSMLLERIRGYEGAGAMLYFPVFGSAIREPWYFQDRNRRPPKDPVNALLSFAYTLLLGKVTTAVVLAGLDPCVGWLHPEYRGRPSAALDLMEEFRSPIVDRALLSALNQNYFSPEDFLPDEPIGMKMSINAKKMLIRIFSERLNVEVLNQNNQQRSTYAIHIQQQAQLLAQALRGKNTYLPFIVQGASTA